LRDFQPAERLLPAAGRNASATPFMQYRSPVGFGPSSNTWPKWPPHRLQCTSVRVSSSDVSVDVAIACGSGA
jgi:hypothetical protein